MKDKEYHFLVGLPRSGSTVLASILNQNPDIYVTPTSPMLDVTVAMQKAWRENSSVKANYYEEQARNLTKAILPAFWQHRSERIIIDKCRSWAKNMPTASSLFGYPVKAIFTDRDLPSIMASWLTLLKQNFGNIAAKNIELNGCRITNDNLMAELWFSYIKECMEFRSAIKKDAPNQFIIINYDELIRNPHQELLRIENFLSLPSWTYQFDNIVNDTVDDDLVAWGITGLHTIRPKLEKISNHPSFVLGEILYNRFIEIEKNYEW